MICSWVRTMVRMVVSGSTCASQVCQPSRRATAANDNSWGNKQAQEMQAASDDDAVVRWQHSIAGHHLGLGIRMYTDLPGQFQRSEAAGNGDGLMAVSVDYGGGKNAGDAVASVVHQSSPTGPARDA